MLTKKRICILISCLALVFVSMVYVSSDVLLTERTAAGPVNNDKVIVLDAGHGGMDSGAVGGSGTLEKDVNLAIALKMQDALRAMGYRVVMTRESDVSLNDPNLSTVRSQKVADMHARLAIIEQYPKGIFLSIHQNKFEQSQYHGTQVFFSKNNPNSEVIAKSVQSAVVEMLQPENNRVAKSLGSESYLLSKAQIPAVIVECGFLSNPEEEAKLQDEEYQNQLTISILCGLLNSGCV